MAYPDIATTSTDMNNLIESSSGKESKKGGLLRLFLFPAKTPRKDPLLI
jgi:hypothetical protein